MKAFTVELKDGPHVLTTPTFYALQLMAENGIDLLAPEGIAITPSLVSGVLAALMTDSEPVGDNGAPARLWSPVEVAKQMKISDTYRYIEIANSLIEDAIAVEGEATRPNPKRGSKTGAKSPS